MLRRANEDETAAFLLVERTLQRTRPLRGARGVTTVDLPLGRIERGTLGRLRFRFDGSSSDFEPENPAETRSLSGEELSLWNGLKKLVATAHPVTDSEWNLVSLRLGPRVLRRLPLGSIVTFVPNGTQPFKGSFALSLPKVQAKPDIPVGTEADLLHAIDVFLLEEDSLWGADPRTMGMWTPGRTANRHASHIFSTSLGHGRRHGTAKWHKCPICHTPVVKGLFNPRIPYGPLRPGVGAIRDLRGGYLTRLRETYLLGEPASLVTSSESVP